MVGSRPRERDAAPSRATVRTIAIVVLLFGAAMTYLAYAGNARDLGVRRNGVEVTATVTHLPTSTEPGRLTFPLDGRSYQCNLVSGRTRAAKGQTLRVVADTTDLGACVPASRDLMDLARTALVLALAVSALGGGLWLLRNA